MLSSIILSMAMSVSPAPVADAHNLDIQEIGERRGGLRINADNNLDIQEIGERRGGLRINTDNDLDIQEIGERRGGLRF